MLKIIALSSFVTKRKENKLAPRKSQEKGCFFICVIKVLVVGSMGGSSNTNT